MLGEIDNDLIFYFEVDVVSILTQTNIFGYKNSDFKRWNMFEGTPVLIPDEFNTEYDKNGNIQMYPQGDENAPACAIMPKDFLLCLTVSNHIANLSATIRILNREHFSNMLSNAAFINTGHGAQVVEKDLIIKALKAVPSRTAVLDVTYPEPPSDDSEFL